MQSAIGASIGLGWAKDSSDLLKAFNYHAIACLPPNAGVYRPCQVNVVGRDESGNPVTVYAPHKHYAVPSLMESRAHPARKEQRPDGRAKRTGTSVAGSEKLPDGCTLLVRGRFRGRVGIPGTISPYRRRLTYPERVDRAESSPL